MNIPFGMMFEALDSLQQDEVYICTGSSNPGDIVYGDRDGVLIIPSEIEKEAFEGAIEKARGELLVKKALETGMSTVDAFRKFGIM